jgi:uncharacterized protein (TIGR00255 family)
MLYSMTGFATKTVVISGKNKERTNVSISIKSLNSRFFDTTFKIHYTLAALEHRILSLTKQSLNRGHIYCTIHVSNPSAFSASVQPSLATARSYYDGLEKIREYCAISQPITLDHLVRLPNLFSIEESDLDTMTVASILDSVQEVIDEVVTVRLQEGTALQKDICYRLQTIHQEMEYIAQKISIVVARHKEKMIGILQEVCSDEMVLATVHKNVFYTMLEKMDIHEELVRFTTHADNLMKYLSSQANEQGKRIDFVLQELMREINTIAAKCSDTEISERAITIKVEIEKMREQAQNIV